MTYWQLRKYKGQGEAGIGLEKTPEEYLEHLVGVFRECWRVLRDDGMLWVNIGDTRGGGRGDSATPKQASNTGSNLNMPLKNSLNLYGIPERFALAMQADGWVWRDTVVWWKSSPMPESVSGTRWERCRIKVEKQRADTIHSNTALASVRPTLSPDYLATWQSCTGCPKCIPNDGWVLRKGSWRCTDAYEQIFMFVKGQGYWADGEGVRQPNKEVSIKRAKKGLHQSFDPNKAVNADVEVMGNRFVPEAGANLRNVWDLKREYLPKSFSGQHFATFPPSLPERCIRISTSDKGCCPHCGSQWARMIDKEHPPKRTVDSVYSKESSDQPQGSFSTERFDEPIVTNTLGWKPTCSCPPHEPIPSIVLDPFCGMGTTLLAAARLGRRGIGTDLSGEYLELARRRLEGDNQTRKVMEYQALGA